LQSKLIASLYNILFKLKFQTPGVANLNDVSFRNLLNELIIWKLKAMINLVEAALLHGDLKDQIFMDIAPGMKAYKD
jgi:hypothetical protein